MRTAVVLLTRDLRVHDNPALTAACRADRVVPLYVLDPKLAGLSPNRTRFLHQSLADLRENLRSIGGDLVVRHGDPVTEAVRVACDTGAETIHVAADVSGHARRRESRLRDETGHHRIGLHLHPGLTVVDPGAIRPGGGGECYKVFTPYFRVWSGVRRRAELPAPERLTLPDGLDPGRLPDTPGGDSPHAAEGGETAARRRLSLWSGQELAGYGDAHDDMPGDATSRLSPYLRWGCVSPLTVAETARKQDADAFVRQLCWRDFYYQVARVYPKLSTEALRPAGDRDWRYDDALQHWQDGLTGVPIVDAGMRQLRDEGWMHNRARLITAAFLTKHLGIDWRLGVQWFFRWLLDGDVPNNSGNWQWTAGVGNDTRPYRRFNPIRQALRFDPDGVYVRRYVPELKGIDGPAVHQPWRLPETEFRSLGYPGPLESHRDEAVWLR